MDNYAGSNRGRIQGRKFEQPLLELVQGRGLIEVTSPASALIDLIEATRTSDGFENRDFMRPNLNNARRRFKDPMFSNIACFIHKPLMDQEENSST